MVTGKEEGHFVTGSGKNRQHHHVKKNLVNFKATIVQFQEVLGVGDYVVPFEFTMPLDAPACMVHSGTASSSAKLRYVLKVKLNTKSNQSLKYKQWLIIHEQPKAFIENFQVNDEVDLIQCCCIPQGKGSLSVKFNKNTFFSNENIIAEITSDNS